MKLTKKCIICGNIIIKPQNESIKNWNNRRKYCSKECANKARVGKPTWNKGLKGKQVAWNKGKKMQHTVWNKNKKITQTLGSKNGMWKGDDVGYFALHSWIRRELGKASQYKCKCGEQAQEWSNVDHKYRRNIRDYQALCVRCHRNYDKKHFNC